MGEVISPCVSMNDRHARCELGHSRFLSDLHLINHISGCHLHLSNAFVRTRFGKGLSTRIR